MERGRTRPYRNTVEALCRALDLGDAERAEVWIAWRSPCPSSGHPSADEPNVTLPAPQSHNLLLRMTSFVGRTQEVAELEDLLASNRLVSLVGPPGVGKSRLALALGDHMLGRYPDGVWLTELAPLGEASLLTQVVCTIFGVTEQPERPLADTLADYLKSKQLLVILDNCEHLIGACAALTEGLLTACPHISVLTTSREPLGIDGETTWRVPSLAQPDPTDLPHVDALRAIESVTLFIDRARTVRPGFALSTENGRAVAEICRRLDGIPLAIELAAARTNVLTVEQIEARLTDRFNLLTGGRRRSLPRQQTLRASVDWSYDLLSPDEGRLLRRMSVFAGGCTLEAAELVCADDKLHRHVILDALSGLADKSLVVVTAWRGESRYSLLETLRQYGMEKLRDAGEEAVYQRRHAEWCLKLVEAAAPHTEDAEQVRWLARLAIEQDNLRAALAWCEPCDGPSGSSMGLRLLDVLSHFWFKRQEQTEARNWINRIVNVELGPANVERVRVLDWAAEFAAHQNDLSQVDNYAGEALRLSREIGYQAGEALALTKLANNADTRQQHAEAAAMLEDALRISILAKDDFSTWFARNNLAETFRHHGYNDRATQLIEANLALARQRNDEWGIAQGFRLLGLVAEANDDYLRASEFLEESLTRWLAMGASRGPHWSFLELGRVVLARGDIERARSLMRESLRLCVAVWHRREIARCLEGFAILAASTGQPARAVQLFGAAEKLREVSSLPALPNDRKVFARALDMLHEALADDAFAAAWDAGRCLPVDDAIATAQELGGTSELSAAPLLVSDLLVGHGQTGQKQLLTARQLEVLRLVATGMSDREIAAELGLSERTVGRHLENIFARLSVSSRAAAAALAERQGLNR
jgi:non-specific serine/threonine protein kinase